MGFPRQEYWSGLPSPSPGDLSDPGIDPLWLHQFTFPPAVQEGSLFTTSSPAFTVCRFFFDDGHSEHCEVISHCSFDFHRDFDLYFLMAYDVEYLLI